MEAALGLKKILVLSDSHGNLNNMVYAVKYEQPDMLLHLGDCWADAQKLKKKFPDIPLEQVPGNCDCNQEFQERILLIEGKRVFICHGHTQNVKAGYLNLQYTAQEEEVDVALFGHTHRVFYRRFRATVPPLASSLPVLPSMVVTYPGSTLSQMPTWFIPPLLPPSKTKKTRSPGRISPFSTPWPRF